MLYGFKIYLLLFLDVRRNDPMFSFFFRFMFFRTKKKRNGEQRNKIRQQKQKYVICALLLVG